MSKVIHFRVDGEPGCGTQGPCTGILGNVTCPACRALDAFKDARSMVQAVNVVEVRRAGPPKRILELERPRPPYKPSCPGPGFLRCCDPDGCRELGCVRQFEPMEAHHGG